MICGYVECDFFVIDRRRHIVVRQRTQRNLLFLPMSFCILRVWILSMPIQSKYFYTLGHGLLRFLQISTPGLCDLELTIEGGPEVVIGEMEITVVDNLCQAGRGHATVAITFSALRSYYPSL